MGRPRHLPKPPQRRQVEAMAGDGPRADISRMLGHIVASGKAAKRLFRKARRLFRGEGPPPVSQAVARQSSVRTLRPALSRYRTAARTHSLDEADSV